MADLQQFGTLVAGMLDTDNAVSYYLGNGITVSPLIVVSYNL